MVCARGRAEHRLDAVPAARLWRSVPAKLLLTSMDGEWHPGGYDLALTKRGGQRPSRLAGDRLRRRRCIVTFARPERRGLGLPWLGLPPTRRASHRSSKTDCRQGWRSVV